MTWRGRYTRLLDWLDDLAHRHLDGYIDARHLGWGLVQETQWRLCNAYERSLERITRE